MAKIVRFPLERTNLPTMERHNINADIVIFPGIRIERREFDLPKRPARAGQQRSGKKHGRPAFK